MTDGKPAPREPATASRQISSWSAVERSARASLRPGLIIFGRMQASRPHTAASSRAAFPEIRPIIFAMLAVLVLVSSLLAGYGMAGGGTRNWLHMLIFMAMMSIAVYVILDLEYPRFGLIRVDATDQLLIDLRQSWK